MATKIDPKNHIGLIAKVASYYAIRGNESYEDLFQIGYLGLNQAADRFNSEMGYKFGSFAVPYIRGAILHYLRDEADLMRSPRDGRKNRVISLDVPVYDGDESVYLIDTIAAPISEGLDYPEVREALNQLEHGERCAIVLYYWCDLRQWEIAERLNSTPQTIGRWIKRGQRKLKEILRDDRQA